MIGLNVWMVGKRLIETGGSAEAEAEVEIEIEIIEIEIIEIGSGDPGCQSRCISRGDPGLQNSSAEGNVFLVSSLYTSPFLYNVTTKPSIVGT